MCPLANMAKTVVSMQNYTTHHDPRYFPDPFTFNPNRWLSTDGGTDEMKKLYMPFTKGARTCLGQSLALLELRITIATIVLKYDIRINEATTEQGLEMTDHFLLIPKGRCLLDFTPMSKTV